MRVVIATVQRGQHGHEYVVVQVLVIDDWRLYDHRELSFLLLPAFLAVPALFLLLFRRLAITRASGRLACGVLLVRPHPLLCVGHGHGHLRHHRRVERAVHGHALAHCVLEGHRASQVLELVVAGIVGGDSRQLEVPVFQEPLEKRVVVAIGVAELHVGQEMVVFNGDEPGFGVYAAVGEQDVGGDVLDDRAYLREQPDNGSPDIDGQSKKKVSCGTPCGTSCDSPHQ
ncbi:MAG: hypothetical protein BZ138_06485 [Methanosphaera sp. rholeuAM270]|nr:MAG: hypothetical protein BZ138_06485 [Methanosphaera sp. rholeuAM270]